MSEALDLPTLLQQNAKQADRQFNTVAEVLLQRLVSEQNTRLRAPVDSTCPIRPRGEA